MNKSHVLEIIPARRQQSRFISHVRDCYERKSNPDFSPYQPHLLRNSRWVRD